MSCIQIAAVSPGARGSVAFLVLLFMHPVFLDSIYPWLPKKSGAKLKSGAIFWYSLKSKMAAKLVGGYSNFVSIACRIKIPTARIWFLGVGNRLGPSPSTYDH